MKKTALLLAALCLIASSASAATIRCKGQMIKPGKTKYDLRKYCGEPDEINIIGTSKAKSRYAESEAVREEWYYNRLDRGKDVVFIVTGTRITDVGIID